MTFLNKRKNLALHFGLALSLFALALSTAATIWQRVSGQGGSAVTIVSAASFEAAVAPDAIVAAFGGRLATTTAVATGDADPNTPGIQLPATLGGTTVEVNGQRAGLFFVSPGQVNFVIPATTAPGGAAVSVRASDGAVSMGTARVEAAVPAIFSADSSGQGLPAAVLLRVLPNGEQRFEPVVRFDPATGKFTAIPIDLGPPGERVFLILYLTGIRGAAGATSDGNYRETVHVLIGGDEIVPAFAGRAGSFVGLDQINVELQRALIGRGAVDLRVNYSSLAQSNPVRIEIGGPPSPVSVTGFGAAQALVGDEVAINGANFAPNAAGNQVFFVDEEGKSFAAKINAATANQIRAVIPFGSGSGPVLVRTPQNEALSAARLALRTSISGFVETTEKQPLTGVTVRVREQSISAVTDAEGKFILRDVPPGLSRDVEIDPSPLPLPFPKFATKLRVRAGRDHHLEHITLRQITGPSLAFTTPGSLATATPDLDPTNAFVPTTRIIQSGGVIFEVADNTTAIFPGGVSAGSVFLNILENSRTPAKLPPGVFSSTIAQLAPFGARLAPGGKLTFPNADNLPTGSQPKLYKLDQTLGSPTLGEFIEAGAATVSAGGQRVETAANAIVETSIYFVAIPRPVTNVIGRVVDSDGATPMRGARVSTRGQEVTTDGTGLFVLLNVPVLGASDRLTIEASFQRPGGRVDRAERGGITPVPNGTTRVADLALSSPSTSPNRPPVVVVPPSLTVTEGMTRDVGFLASDPDSGQTIQVMVTGAAFASSNQVSGSTYNLRLTPGAGAAGNYTLAVMATDNLGASTTQNIVVTVIVPGTSQWTQTAGPGGGTIYTLLASGGNLFAGTEGGGLFRSTDGGLNWNSVNSGLGDLYIRSLAINAGALFAGTRNAGVFRTTDNGASWAQVSNGLGNRAVTSLAVSGTILFGGTNTGVFRTADNGANWTLVNNGMGNLLVNCLAVSGTTLFAGTGSGVFRTTDNGANWTQVNNGLSNQFVISLAVSGTTLFAGTSGGVFRSVDNGASWTAVNNGLTNLFVSALAVSGASLFAGTGGRGVFRTTDNGANWTAANNEINNQQVLSLAMSGTTLFAGTVDAGVFRTMDDGANWADVNRGLGNLSIFSLAVSGTSLFAGAVVAFRSTDDGANWAQVDNGLGRPLVRSFAVSGTSLFAGTNTGVFRTTDSGANWTAVNSGLGTLLIDSLAVSGTSLFAGTRNNGVFRTTDNGANWTAVNNGLGNQWVTSFAVSGGVLFAGTNGNGVFRTTDNGANWTAVNNGLSNLRVRAFALSGANLFAGTDSGVFRTTDNGASWTAVNNGLGNRAITCLAVSGVTVFAGTFTAEVFRTTDDGANWTLFNEGLTVLRVNALAVSGNNLFAGTEGRSVLVRQLP